MGREIACRCRRCDRSGRYLDRERAVFRRVLRFYGSPLGIAQDDNRWGDPIATRHLYAPAAVCGLHGSARQQRGERQHGCWLYG